MKKLFAKIISLAVAMVMSLFVLSGCQLISVNVERDMAQIIATVEVDPELKQDIYKRELVAEYNSTGYYYVQYQGMTQKETYELLLENIVKNEILVQQARIELTKTNGYFADAKQEVEENGGTSIENVLSTKNWLGEETTSIVKTSSLDKFLTEFEYYEVRYSMLSTVEQFINGYKDDEEDEHEHDPYETFQGTARATLTIPTEKTYDEWEMKNDPEASVIDEESDFYKSYEKANKDAKLELNLSDRTLYPTKYDLALAVYKKYCDDFTVENEDKVAVNRLVKDLKKLGFISSAEAAKKTPTTANELLALTYFSDLMKTQYENKVIGKYELALRNKNEKKLANDVALWQAYLDVYETQENNYKNDFNAYETALSTASDSKLIVYNPSAVEGKYGYVMNLLIGFSDEQTAIFDNISTNGVLSKGQKQKALENLLKTLTAKDLRDSWVEKNYGSYDETTNKFTFEDKYVKTQALKEFAGDIYGAKSYVYHDNYDDEKTAYSYKSVKGKEIPFNTFYSSVSSIMGFEGNSGRLSGYTNEEVIKDSDFDKFKDLVFAYSTDSGSLQDNYGYVYSPKTSKDTYVPEFAEAAKKAVNGGVGSYELVATEYGYHIILCTKVINPTSTYIGRDEFIAQANDKSNTDSIPYLFKEYQKETLISDNVSKFTETFFKTNLESAVTYYTEIYEDLLKE